jgi:hypothetical protein
VISAPIVRANNLLKVVTAKVPNPGKPKVDGVDALIFETTTARIDAIKLGLLVMDRALVALSTDADGQFAMDDIGVNLGGNVLRRFKALALGRYFLRSSRSQLSTRAPLGGWSA